MGKIGEGSNRISYEEPQTENLDEVQLDLEFYDRIVLIGAHLDSTIREEMIALLREYQDCFAWSHADMTEIDPTIITHQLQVDPNFTPVKLKRLRFTSERKCSDRRGSTKANRE